MPNYRRWRQMGGNYFFTVNLQDRRLRLLVENVDQLRQAIATCRSERPFEIEAAVILPEHLHMIWSLPDDDNDFSTRWRIIKSRFSKSLNIETVVTERQRRKQERGIWQRGFYEHLIRNEADFERHVDYIHYNPVKHRHCDTPIDWPHSSLRTYVQRGILDSTWGTSSRPQDIDLD